MGVLGKLFIYRYSFACLVRINFSKSGDHFRELLLAIFFFAFSSLIIWVSESITLLRFFSGKPCSTSASASTAEEYGGQKEKEEEERTFRTKIEGKGGE